MRRRTLIDGTKGTEDAPEKSALESEDAYLTGGEGIEENRRSGPTKSEDDWYRARPFVLTAGRNERLPESAPR